LATGSNAQPNLSQAQAPSRFRSFSVPLGGALLVFACILGSLTGCERKPLIPPTPPPPLLLQLTPTTYGDLPGWTDDRVSEALPALTRSCNRVLRLEPAAPIGPRAVGGTAADWRQPCTVMANAASDDTSLRTLLESEFTPVQVSAGGNGEGIFTGYYEVELDGARAPSSRFQVPLYRRPADLLSANLGNFANDLSGRTIFGRVDGDRFVPYASRAEIDRGVLAGRGLELLWVEDPVDAFILQIQGSGRIRLADGGVMRVGFAAANGQPFFAIGRALVDRGAVPKDKASMQDIRAWLKAHPEEARSIMQMNRRYIFFREVAGDGPIGAEGVPLTAGRSLAVDTSLLPLGVPVWLDTSWPSDPGRPLRRLMVAQDTGAAIQGPVRGDFFWGTGEAALAEAGRMKSAGRYWLLLPKSVVARMKPTS
jgi:membrane-bound lytic murein transglycosylase A